MADIKQLVNDPDFLDLPESEQDSIIESMQKQQAPSDEDRAAKYGTITEAPTGAEKLIGRLTSKETRPLGITGGLGVGLSALGIPEENILPAVGQAAGTPFGFLGSTGGAVAGQAVKQLAQPLRGKSGSIGEVGKEGLVTGLIEGLTRGTGKMFFRKQVAAKTLETVGKELGQMKDAMRSNPAIQINAPQLGANLEAAFANAPDPLKRGPQASVIKDWIKYLKGKKNLSADDVLSLEEHLGETARFGTKKAGIHVSPTVKNPRMNKIAKGGRKEASDIVDTVAEQSGQVGFKKKSMEVHKLLEKFPELDPTKGYGSWSGRMGTAIGTTAVTGSPLAGALAYGAEKAIQSPGFRNAAFGAVTNPIVSGAGTATKLTLSELMRRKKKSG